MSQKEVLRGIMSNILKLFCEGKSWASYKPFSPAKLTIVISGSADGTNRPWRVKNGTEMCVFNCGVDIFYVTISRDKGTIIALGDKFLARKLIKLQVVRTMIKKIVSS
ncbi:hypothetical protein DPMN_156897 [Dreissena polymorpha]|uniref:Uncharacterized protein n=2 Tax=Dreissena polymorpha TaxID=45954 RepID=A0A9D4J7Z6_DREPO|nr:hypothetical protein DPMN_156897 [Dreissena polymorpha]